MKRTIIIEDHPVVVFNLRLGLHGYDDVEIIESFSCGKSLLDYQSLNTIDVALLDINLPDINGFEICTFLKEHYPHMKIIGISSFDDYEHIAKFMECGANGYIVKGAKNSVMLDAINKVLAGGVYLCEVAYKRLYEDEILADLSVKLTQYETRLLKLARINPSIEFISGEIGEDIERTSLYIKMLKDKIDFYNLPLEIDLIS